MDTNKSFTEKIIFEHHRMKYKCPSENNDFVVVTLWERNRDDGEISLCIISKNREHFEQSVKLISYEFRKSTKYTFRRGYRYRIMIGKRLLQFIDERERDDVFNYIKDLQKNEVGTQTDQEASTSKPFNLPQQNKNPNKDLIERLDELTDQLINNLSLSINNLSLSIRNYTTGVKNVIVPLINNEGNFVR